MPATLCGGWWLINVGSAFIKNNPARTRTWKNRTKICCVTDYTTGFWKLSLVVAETESDFSQFLADFVERCNAEIAAGEEFVGGPLTELSDGLDVET